MPQMPTYPIKSQSQYPSKPINPVHAVCFTLMGAFAIVVAVTVTDRLMGDQRFSLSHTPVQSDRPAPGP